MTRTLLIVGGGTQAVAGIQMARDMGLHIVISDRNPEAPGFAFAHDRLIADTYNPAQTLVEAVRYHTEVRPIDGVMCMATDVPLTVSTVAQELGLPTIPIEVAKRAIDKFAMKEKFSADGVNVPWYARVHSADGLQECVDSSMHPLIVKPVDSRGSRGVLRLTEGTDCAWAFAVARDQSPTDRVMVEQFLDGPQVSTESVVIDGVAHTPGFSDRNYEHLDRYAPHVIENGGDLPSFLPQDTQRAVCDLVTKAAQSLGVVNGIVKGDIVVHNGVPHVIELAARLSGGYFCTHEIPLNTGVSTVKAAIQIALGDTPDATDLKPKFQHPVCQRYLFPTPGMITSIEGVEEARTLPGIEIVDIWVKVGDTIVAPVNSGSSAAMVIAVGGDRGAAKTRARTALDCIKIVTS